MSILISVTNNTEVNNIDSLHIINIACIFLYSSQTSSRQGLAVVIVSCLGPHTLT